MTGLLKPFRAPKPLPILDSSKIVPKIGFPVVKAKSSELRLFFVRFVVRLGHVFFHVVDLFFYSPNQLLGEV